MKFTLISFHLKDIVGYCTSPLKWRVQKKVITVNESNFILNHCSAASTHDSSVLFFSFIVRPLWLILTSMPGFLEGTGCFVTVYFVLPYCEERCSFLLEFGDTCAASAWRSTCLMYALDIKRSQWAQGEGESLFKKWGETNQTNVEEKLREREGGGW